MSPMPDKRTALLALAATGLLGTLLFLFVRTEAGEFRGGARALELLRELKEVDARLDREATRLADDLPAAARSGASGTTSPLDAGARFGPAMRELGQRPARDAVAADLPALRDGIAAKGAAFRALTTAHGATIDALASLDRALDALVPASPGGRAIEPARAARLDTLAARLANVRDAAHRDEIDRDDRVAGALEPASVAGIPAAATAADPALAAAALAAHEAAHAFFAARAREAEAYRRLAFLTLGARVDLAARTLSRRLAAALDEQARWRIYLFAYAAALLLGVGVLAWRVVAAQLALRVANEDLERRVAERTRDLGRAVEQLKESEAQLVQTEKMSSLGQMVAGVAHEINTPLAYVKNSLSIARSRVPDLREAQRLAARLAELLEVEPHDAAAVGEARAALVARLAEIRSDHVMEDLDALTWDGLERHRADRRAGGQSAQLLAHRPQPCRELQRERRRGRRAAHRAPDAAPHRRREAPGRRARHHLRAFAGEPGAVEPHHQRRAGDGQATRADLGFDAQRGRRRGRDRGDRQRPRHPPRRAAAHFRSVLHHQGSGQGNRPGAVDRLQDRLPARRAHRRALAGRCRQHLHGDAAPEPAGGTGGRRGEPGSDRVNVPDRIGRYQVRELLGRGSAGAVYRGFDEGIQRPVALKVIAKDALEEVELGRTLARFRREAQVAGRINHPSVAAVYDFVETDALACIVMELVEGQSLALRLKEVGLYDRADAWNIARAILDGLAYCHGQGVVHRDLKPANILVSDDGRVKITDFGVARVESTSLTQVGEILGTPQYMSPEQCRGETATVASDLYQVAVIVYEIVTGERPFDGKPAEILRQVLNERPAEPSSLNPDITAEVDAVLARALAKDPAGRFESAWELSQALQLAFGMTSEHTREAGEATFVAARDAREARVLFVDDDERILNALRAIFRNRHQVFTARSAAHALELVRRFGMHVVVADQRMPQTTGVELLREVKAISPGTVRMLLTGYSDLAAIVGAVNEGEIFRYLRKPWDNLELQADVADAVAIALEARQAGEAEAATRRDAAAVLVIERAPELSVGLQHLLGATVSVLHAPSRIEATQLLAAREIGVIVAPLAADDQGLAAFLAGLRAQHPEMLSIVVTDAPDSERVIELINEAHIYRFLTRPLDASDLRTQVEAALRWHAMLGRSARTPRGDAGDPLSSSTGAAAIVERIRGIPGRLFARSRG